MVGYSNHTENKNDSVRRTLHYTVAIETNQAKQNKNKLCI